MLIPPNLLPQLDQEALVITTSSCCQHYPGPPLEGFHVFDKVFSAYSPEKPAGILAHTLCRSKKISYTLCSPWVPVWFSPKSSLWGGCPMQCDWSADNLVRFLLHLFHFSNNNDASLNLYLPVPVSAVEEDISEDLDLYGNTLM